MSISIAYFRTETAKLEKIIEDSYGDVFPKDKNIGTTEDIYSLREECQDKIRELREKLFENHVVMFGNPFMKAEDEVGFEWKKLAYTDFTLGGNYTIVNKKYEHIVDAFIENNDVGIFYCGNGIDSSDMLEPCENFPELYDEDLHFELEKVSA